MPHAPHASYSNAARVAVLVDDGNYLSSETPAQRAKLRTREMLWQAIQRTKLWHPQVNDDEMPSATAEQARVHGLNRLPSHVARHAMPRATRRSKLQQNGLPRWAGEQIGWVIN